MYSEVLSSFMRYDSWHMHCHSLICGPCIVPKALKHNTPKIWECLK